MSEWERQWADRFIAALGHSPITTAEARVAEAAWALLNVLARGQHATEVEITDAMDALEATLPEESALAALRKEAWRAEIGKHAKALSDLASLDTTTAQDQEEAWVHAQAVLALLEGK